MKENKEEKDKVNYKDKWMKNNEKIGKEKKRNKNWMKKI